jgi:hypothetical protein
MECVTAKQGCAIIALFFHDRMERRDLWRFAASRGKIATFPHESYLWVRRFERE